MFWCYQNAGSPHAAAFREGFFSCYRIRKTGGERLWKAKQLIKKKGGRPKKDIKRDQVLHLKCTLLDRKVIQAKAKLANLTVSDYLRQMALAGKIDRRERALPKEVLQLTGTLNHAAANLNQIAKKRNGIDELNALERAGLMVQSGELKRLAEEIKTYFK